jgi:hypothetical protein
LFHTISTGSQCEFLVAQHQQQAAQHARHLAQELTQLEQRLTPPSQETGQLPHDGEPIADDVNDGPSVLQEFEGLFEYDRQGPYADLFREIERRVTMTRVVHSVPGFCLQTPSQ